MEKSFNNLKMMAWSDSWPKATAISNSNPAPFTAAELSEVTGDDFSLLPLDDLEYQSTQGDLELRQMMVNQWYSRSQVNDLMLTAGAQEALFIAFQAIVKKGDHVVCFTPCFEPLTLMPEQLGARITRLPLTDDWQIDFDALATALKDDAKVLVLNFPHNPTGAHISQQMLNEVLQLCAKQQVFVISDEVFRGLEHDPDKRLPAVANIYKNAISIGVMSKAFAMPAVRVGWLLCQNHQVYQRMLAIKNHLSICVSGLDVAFMKKAIPFDELIWQRSVALINFNKGLLNKALRHHPAFNCHMGEASATCYVVHDDARIWASDLADQRGFKVLPAHCFETDIQGFRLSLGIKNFQQILDSIWPQSN